MTDLTDAELTEMYDSTNDPRILMLIAEVRRWRAVKPGQKWTSTRPAWLETRAVRPPEGADGPEGAKDE